MILLNENKSLKNHNITKNTSNGNVTSLSDYQPSSNLSLSKHTDDPSRLSPSRGRIESSSETHSQAFGYWPLPIELATSSEVYNFNSWLYNEYNRSKHNKYSSNYIGDDNMDKILEKYIDKLDRDQSDLRHDMRASEERIAKLIEDSNERTEDSYNRIEDLIKEYKLDNSRLESKFDSLQEKVSKDVKENKNFALATLISIVAILVTFIIGIVQIVTAIK